MSFRGDEDVADIREMKLEDRTQNERRPWNIARYDFSTWQVALCGSKSDE
jgi:hypothetical protein